MNEDCDKIMEMSNYAQDVMMEKCKFLMHDKATANANFRVVGAMMSCSSVELEAYFQPFAYLGSPATLLGALKQVSCDMIMKGRHLNVLGSLQNALLGSAVLGASMECLPQTCIFVGAYFNTEENTEKVTYAISGSLIEAQGLVEMMINDLTEFRNDYEDGQDPKKA